MAIFAIICFGLAFFSENSKFAKLIFFFVFLLLLTTVYLTQAKQGLIMIALGLTTICLVWSSKFKSKIPLLAGSGISFIIGSFSILGMLNIGPLSRYLYKSSVSYRGDYWRIALRMIREHPFAGVGLDSYGIFFRNYRDLKQIGRRGPDLISNAAHNIPLQLASTGGILLALSYICLNLFILFKAIQKIRNLQGNPRLILATFFAAWLAYQAQSLISIDNLAIAIWGYVLGGVIIGLSIDERPGFKISPPKIYQPLVSSFFAILAILLFSFLYKSEHAMLVLSQTQVPKVDAQFSKYETIAMAPLSHTFIEPTFAFNVADDLAQISRFDTAIQIIKKEISKDPNNFGGNNLLAHIYEFRHEWGKAIELRKLNVKLDPFNYKNMYQLVIDFVAQSKLNDAQKYSAKIIKIAPSSEEAAKVKTLWTNK
jgi:tetratricopeptide (TPR) repeat protein